MAPPSKGESYTPYAGSVLAATGPGTGIATITDPRDQFLQEHALHKALPEYIK